MSKQQSKPETRAAKAAKRKRSDVSPSRSEIPGRDPVLALPPHRASYATKRRTSTTRKRQQEAHDDNSSTILRAGESSTSFVADLRRPLAEIDDAESFLRAPSAPLVAAAGARSDLSMNAGWILRQHIGGRRGPLPPFSWTDSDDLWQYALSKDAIYRKDEFYLKRNHPRLTSRMRAILLEWLIEVCDVFEMHRETFYLAAEYCDRFLTRTCSYGDGQLQLIGVTSLFIAAKVEEIYPPKIVDFADVTDGACTTKQIEEMELLQLQTLGWMLSPITPNSWLSVFLQLANVKSMKKPSENFLTPAYSQQDFIKAIQLMDLCMMDIGSLRFPNSVLAASSMCLMLRDDFSWETTGQSWERVCECVQWMRPFFLAIRRGTVSPVLRCTAKVAKDQRHVIQSHFNILKLLDEVKSTRQAIQTGNLMNAEPATLTPPGSAEKQTLTVGSDL